MIPTNEEALKITEDQRVFFFMPVISDKNSLEPRERKSRKVMVLEFNHIHKSRRGASVWFNVVNEDDSLGREIFFPRKFF